MTVPVLMTAAALASSPPPLPGFLEALSSPLQHFGVWAIALLIMVEDFGIPVPGETILIAGAVYAGAGRLNIVAVGIAGFIAAIIGDNIGFAIGHFGGRALALRWGKYVFLTEERLNKAEAFFDRRGAIVITFARFVEGLRQANGIIAGITGMHWLRFLIFNAIGAALWVGTWVSLGYLAGDHITTIYHYITLYSYYVLVALVVLVVGYIAWRLRRRRRRRTPPAATRADEPDETRRTEQAAETAPDEDEPRRPCRTRSSRGDRAGRATQAAEITPDETKPGEHGGKEQSRGDRGGRARHGPAHPGSSGAGHVVALQPGQFPRGRVHDPETTLGQRRIRGYRGRRAERRAHRGERIGKVLPVQAQGGRTAFRHQIGKQEPERVSQVRSGGKTSGAAVPGQTGLSLDGPPEARRERADGLGAAQRGRADHPRGRREAGQQASQGLRVGRALRIERPRLVVAVPVRLTPRRGVPDQDQRYRLARHEGRNHRLVVRIGQLLAGLGQRHPGHRVDLVAGRGLVTGAERRPVADPLGMAPADVLHGRQPGAEHRPHAGLLPDLTDRGEQDVLTRLALALGQRPVVVLGPVHEQDLGTSGPGVLGILGRVRRGPPDRRASREGGISHLPDGPAVP